MAHLFVGDKLFFDKRDNTEFDLLTVNETSVEPPQDDGNSLNSPRNLALEATFINHNFSQQVRVPSFKIIKLNLKYMELKQGLEKNKISLETLAFKQNLS